jgi:hypothetical protein
MKKAHEKLGLAVAFGAAAALLVGGCGSGSPSGFGSASGPGAGPSGSTGATPVASPGFGLDFDAGLASGLDATLNSGGQSPVPAGQDGGATRVQENPGNVPADVQQKLAAGGNADPQFRWLYPYDATVFPRGLLPPTLQFDGAAVDAVYVHMSNPSLDYKGFFGASSPARVTFTPALWSTITQAAGGTGDVRVEVTKISAGKVTGPIVETWRIAPGSLRGAVYYGSYDSQLANGPAILRIDPGMPVPTVLMSGTCVGCHSVSADGSTIVASKEHTTEVTVDLVNNAAQLYSMPTAPDKHVLSFAGLTADGTLALTCDNCGDNAWGNQNLAPSRLMNPRTGQVIAAPGFDGVVGAAGMPAFSVDGKRIVFNLYGHTQTTAPPPNPLIPGGWEYNPGHDLALMDFDRATMTFSNLVNVAHDATLFPTWPVLTPDNKWVIYQLGSTTYTRDRATGNLAAVHVASGTTTMLDALNGLSMGKLYLPFADDADKDYEPTILPEAVGGYFWVVFTSRRQYGNTLNDTDPWRRNFGFVLPGSDGGAEAGSRKKLWVAAIDIDAAQRPSASAHDISHPAFYLPGQELGSGNSRGFWSLSPCKHLGNSCTPGVDECCDGSCRPQAQTDGAVAYACSPQQGCAQEYEKCTNDTDCCNPGNVSYLCIGGRCAQPSTRPR